MKNILSVAKNTFKETVRDKILYSILCFAILFLISTTLLGSISLGEDIKIIKDFGLAGIYIFSIIIAIFLGTSLIYKELEKRTLYVVLSKPVSPAQFILGKFFGLWFSVSLNVLIMTTAYLMIIYVKGGGIDYSSLLANLLLIFELSIFVALTVLFSTFTTPLAGTIYSVIFIYIGHSMSMLKESVGKSGAVIKNLTNLAYYILPNLEKFNFRNQVVHDILPSSAEIIYPVIYSLLYSAVLIYLATLALKNQEL